MIQVTFSTKNQNDTTCSAVVLCQTDFPPKTHNQIGVGLYRKDVSTIPQVKRRKGVQNGRNAGRLGFHYLSYRNIGSQRDTTRKETQFAIQTSMLKLCEAPVKLYKGL